MLSSAALVLIAAAVLLFKDLGLEGIAVDEATTTVVEVEMLRDGHWFFPTFRGAPEARKPPLKMWLTAATLALFGEDEFWLRFWDAAFGLGTVALVFWLGNRFAGPVAGAAAALALVTTHDFLFDHGARTNVQDSPLVFFATASLAAYLYGPADRRGGVMVGLLGGAALLVKGVAGLALFAVLGVYELVTRGTRGLLEPRLRWAAAVALLCAALWFVPETLVAAQAVSDEVGKDVGKRIFGGGLFRRPTFYAWKLWGGFGWWLLAVPVAVMANARAGDRRAWLIPIWAIVILAIFTAAGSKYPWYVLPAYPAIALLIGTAAADVVRRVHSARAELVALIVIGALFVPAYLRAYERTGQIRWEYSNLRAFERYASETLPTNVPVILYKEELDHSFAGHETLYAYRLRHRLKLAATADDLCRLAAGSPNGAFAIVPERHLGEIPCIAGHRHSLRLARLSHASREYAPKRIIPIGHAAPPFFMPTEVVIDAASGVGFAQGWSDDLEGLPVGRRLVAESGFLVFDLAAPAASLRLEGGWLIPRPGCEVRVRWNGSAVGKLEETGELATISISSEAHPLGVNIVELARSCPDATVTLARAVARPAGAVDGPVAVSGVRHHWFRAGRPAGREIRDLDAPEGRAIVSGDRRTPQGGFVFYVVTSLQPGHYRAAFSLRARGGDGAHPVAVVDVVSKDGKRTFARRELVPDELATPRGYQTVELDFTLRRPQMVQARVLATGAGELRFGGGTVSSDRAIARIGTRTTRR